MDTPVISMIIHAGWEARIVLIVLLLFSVLTWSIVFERYGYLKAAAAGNRKYRRQFDTSKKMSDLERVDQTAPASPLARLGRIAVREYKRIVADAAALGSAKDLSFFLQSQFAIAAEHAQSSYAGITAKFDRGIFLLAVVSSLSPFLGLMGTVWGIMNSFYEIGKQGSASLPVVAPGIAEALVATLAGLAVAIPTLFFYNYFNRRIGRLENELDEFRELLVARIKSEVLENIFVGQRRSA